jgi:hypothetical protein
VQTCVSRAAYLLGLRSVAATLGKCTDVSAEVSPARIPCDRTLGQTLLGRQYIHSCSVGSISTAVRSAVHPQLFGR